MRFTIADSIADVTREPVVGNVYPIRGGSGARKGHIQVIVALTDTGCVMLTVDKDGNVVAASCYGRHYIQEKTPIAFCDGIEELSFNIRSL